MAVFTASPLTSPAPTVPYNWGQDIQQAQGVQQGQNALTMQGQQVADMQQEVALRPGVAAGDPNALSQLTSIDPAAAQAQRQAQVQNATLPYQMAQARINLLGEGARGVLASDDHPAAYQEWKASLGPMGASLPAQYPGDGPTQQMAFASMNPADFVKYQQTHISAGGGGAAPSTYAGAVTGAESGGNPNATSATSSAAGAGQFINSTWLQEIKAHRPDLAQGQTDQQLLAMRSDPNLSAEMTNDYAQDNAPQLAQHSIPITPASLYAAHHFGPQGAVDLYAAENNDPNTPVSNIFPPEVLKANPGLAGQTAGTLLGGIRARMANVPAGTFGADLAATAPVAQPQQAPTPAASAPPSGLTPLYHGDGTPALAPGAAGYQLARDQTGNVVQMPVPGGPADPAVLQRNKAAEAQATASAAGPIPGGAAVAPPQQAGNGPFPLPPTDPYAGQNNNAALATRMNTDRTEADKTVASDAPLIQKDIANIQFDQQFRQVNAQNPTGPNAGSGLADAARANLPFTPDQAPYQEMKKLTANLQTAALPSGLGRLDLPIIKSVAAQQPTVLNLRNANNNIENIQIAAAQRDIDYRTARAQWAQQFGNLHGFEPVWTDYNNHVPSLAWGQGGEVQLAPNQPKFGDWVGARAPNGRYDPKLADAPGGQAQPAAQQPQQVPQQQPQNGQPPQMQQASAQPAGGGLAALEGHMVQQGGHTFMIKGGQPVLVQ